MQEFNEQYANYIANPIPELKSVLYDLGLRILDTMPDPNSKGEILYKLLFLFPEKPNLYYEMGNIYKNISNNMAACTWYKIGYTMEPTNRQNTMALCKVLYESGMSQHFLELNQNNIFDKFMDDPIFLGMYARVNFHQLYYKNGIQSLLKLIKQNASNKCTTKEQKLEKWKNYHDAGYVFCMLGEIEKSIQYTKKAVDLSIKFNLEKAHKLLSFSNLVCYLDYEYTDHDEMYNCYLQINDYMPNKTPFQFTKNPSPTPPNKIRIGYVSGDFNHHAVGNFIIPILENHDRSKYEIHLFANNTDVIDKYKALAPMHNIHSLSPEEAAKIVNKQKIDILIDLNGHTVKTRLDMFAYNPAPIQITYLGYPNTTGLKAMHYRITDSIADHIETKQKYSEELLRLPNCFLLYKSINQTHPTIPRKTMPMIILGAINKENKNCPPVLAAWKQILKECPNTIMFIKLETLDNNEERQAFYMKHLDLPSERLILINKLSNEAYINVFTNIDILLDTFPYSGTTTTCNALYNSVPVITLYKKDYHVNNVSSSILINAGLPELVSYSPEEYVSKCVALIQDPGRINNYKNELHKQFMKSMEPVKFMQSYEDMLTGVYNKYHGISKSTKPKEPEQNVNNQNNTLPIEISLNRPIQNDLQNNPKNDPKNKQQLREPISNYSNLQQININEISISPITQTKRELILPELLFVCAFDFGSSDLGLNHLQSLRNNNITNYMAFVTDKKCYEKIKSHKFNVTLIDDTGELKNRGFFTKKKNFGESDFIETSFLRYKIIAEQLEKHKAVWYMDVDTVVLQDLNKHYEICKAQRDPKTNKSFDIIFQEDFHSKCSGCMLFSSNQRTIDAAKYMFKGMNPVMPDQHYFAKFMRENPNVFITAIFDPMEFPNGLLYFDLDELIPIPPEFMTIKHQYENAVKKPLAFVHANWMIGIDNKIKALQKHGLWFLS